MDLQPDLGMGLSAKIRLQINLRIVKNPDLEMFGSLPKSLDDGREIIVPIMWFEDTIDSPPVGLMVLLKDVLGLSGQIKFGMTLLFATVLLLEVGVLALYLKWNGKAEKSRIFSP